MNDGVRCGEVEVVHSPGHIASDGSDLLSGQSCGLHQASEISGQELCENDGLVIHSGSDELEKVWVASVRCDIHLPHEEADVVCGDDLVVKTLGSHSLASEHGHPDIGPPSFPQLLCSGSLASTPPRMVGSVGSGQSAYEAPPGTIREL